MRTIAIALGVTLAAGTAAWLLWDGGDETTVEVDGSPDQGKRGGKRGKRRGEGDRGRRSYAEDPLPPLPADATLEDRVARLENEVHSLRTQLRFARARGAGPGSSSMSDEPAVDNRVREIVAEEDQRKTEERQERRKERMQERVDEALTDLSSKLALTDDTRDSIGALWTAEMDTLSTLISEARNGDRPWREVRDEIDKARTKSDDEARALLDETQYAAYEELRPRGPGRRGRGGNRGGGGGPRPSN